MSANADGDSRGSAVHATGEFREGSTSAPQYFLQLFLGNWLLPKYAFKELLSARTSEAQ
jgi:hypothetical protein